MPEVRVTLEDCTDEELQEEYDSRMLGEPEKDLGDFADSEISEEYRHRFGSLPGDDLQPIYEEFRNRGDAPPCLREFIYQQIGRILP